VAIDENKHGPPIQIALQMGLILAMLTGIKSTVCATQDV